MTHSVAMIKNKYLYKGNEYDNLNINTLLKKIGKKINIIIFSEQLFIKKYNIEKEKIDIEKFIDKKVLEDFSNKEELLFHYEYIRKDNCIYLYSIRCNSLKNLYNSIEVLKVTPIQFLVKDLSLNINNKLKCFISIYKFEELYYIVDIEEGIIINSYILNNEEKVKEIVEKSNNTGKIIILDSNLRGLDSQKENIYSNMGEKIYEKLFKK